MKKEQEVGEGHRPPSVLNLSCVGNSAQRLASLVVGRIQSVLTTNTSDSSRNQVREGGWRQFLFCTYGRLFSPVSSPAVLTVLYSKLRFLINNIRVSILGTADI
jgi:hypothetical protein